MRNSVLRFMYLWYIHKKVPFLSKVISYILTSNLRGYAKRFLEKNAKKENSLVDR